MVVTSTSQEIQQQYELYDHYQPDRMEVIPPGVDLTLFSPPSNLSGELSADGNNSDVFIRPAIADSVDRFLIDPSKPSILTMARPDERKNLEKLVEVYGNSPKLQEAANLIMIMGTRDDLRELPKGGQTVINNVLYLIDKYDLYGKVAYPKTHAPDEVPDLYRWVASKKGVFINPALTEPFGLTLLEAGATGLPIVATHDGGPCDIIANCKNGLLIDPLSDEQIEHALLRVLTEPDQWQEWSNAGINGTREHYSWAQHANRYLRDAGDILSHSAVPALVNSPRERRLPEFDRIIITDLDNTLTGDDDALREFHDLLNEHDNIGFGISTGRRLDGAMKLIEELHLPRPDLIETDSGTQIHYGPKLTADRSWRKQIGYAWEPSKVRSILDPLPGVNLQDECSQSEFKISYQIDPAVSPTQLEIKKALREAGVRAKVLLSFGMFLDIIPVRGGSDFSVRHVLWKWGFSPENVLVAGDSGNDIGMLLGRSLGVVVANHGKELEVLRKRPRVFFSEHAHARGILDGINYYQFLGNIVIPNDRIEPQSNESHDPSRSAALEGVDVGESGRMTESTIDTPLNSYQVSHDAVGLELESQISLRRVAPRLTLLWEQTDTDHRLRVEFETRLIRHWSETFALLHELYGTRYDFFYHLEQILLTAAEAWITRPESLRQVDRHREIEPDWFESEKVVGGALYVDLFSENLGRLREQIGYFQELGLTYLHLMPLFAVRPGNNDGGYAISNYRSVDPRLGTIDDLRMLSEELRAVGITLVLDFVFNHTSDEHDWAKRAQSGDREYQQFYYIFPDRTEPDKYEHTLREIFPTVRRGNFTWHDGMQQWVWTTFNNFQWDLNYSNPAVFRAMLEEMFFIASTGIDILRFDAVAFIWKEMGTCCENLEGAHKIIQAFNRLVRIATPGVLFKSEAIVHPDDVVKYIGEDECQISLQSNTDGFALGIAGDSFDSIAKSIAQPPPQSAPMEQPG